MCAWVWKVDVHATPAWSEHVDGGDMRAGRVHRACGYTCAKDPEMSEICARLMRAGTSCAW